MRTRGVAFGPGVGVAYATNFPFHVAVAQQIETAFRFLQLIPCIRFL